MKNADFVQTAIVVGRAPTVPSPGGRFFQAGRAVIEENAQSIVDSRTVVVKVIA